MVGYKVNVIASVSLQKDTVGALMFNFLQFKSKTVRIHTNEAPMNSCYDAIKCIMINIDKINELCINLQ